MESFIDDKPKGIKPKKTTTSVSDETVVIKEVPELEEENEIPMIPIATPVSKLDSIDKANRPTVKEYRADGSSPRRRRAVSMGLSELILPPYTKNVVARYMLKRSDRIDPTTKERPEPQDAWFPGRYTLFDKFEKDPLLKSKLMVNPGPQNITVDDKGVQTRTYDILPIEFTNGYCDVNVEKDYAKYVFMELHPNNGSNQHRDITVMAEFERVDLKNTKSTAFLEAERDFAEDASQAIRKLSNKDLIIGYAVQFGIAVHGRDQGDIKNELREKAFNNPREFYGLSKDIGPAITLNLHTALSYGVIAIVADRHRFIFTESEETIHVYMVDEDPISSFMKAIKSDPEKKKSYDQIVELINYWK